MMDSSIVRCLFIGFIVLIFDIHAISAAPQFVPIAVQSRVYGNDVPGPYEYHYNVEDPPSNTFFGKQEAGDAVGRVSGSYYVYLPDRRLMTVDYHVDGDSGFVPTISFSNPSTFPGTKRF